MIESKELGKFDGFDITAEVWQDHYFIDPSKEFDCYTQEQLEAWRRDEWTFVGVIVRASYRGNQLGSSSLWGIEYGFLPGVEGHLNPLEDNDYLPDLIIEAVNEAKIELAALVNSATDLLKGV